MNELRELLLQDVVAASRRLLGCFLVRGERVARIVETEAYRAEDDPACHAYRRKTLRNAVMWGPPGHGYVFLNYGMHWMLNVTAHEEGRAAAVLIRAARPVEGLDLFRAARGVPRDVDLLSGPGKLAKGFGIDRSLDGHDLLAGDDLTILPGPAATSVSAGPRIGISQGVDLPWRFCDLDDRPWVSPPRPKI